MRTIRKWVLALAIAPYALIYTGAASNQLVIWANNGKFPVAMNSVRLAGETINSDGMMDPVHCVMTSATRLNLLADIFDFGPGGINSVGDIMIDAGVNSREYCLVVALCLVLFKRPRYEC